MFLGAARSPQKRARVRLWVESIFALGFLLVLVGRAAWEECEAMATRRPLIETAPGREEADDRACQVK